MAENSFEAIALKCPICYDLLNHPVTLSCGHSFCRGCIENSWPPERRREQRLKCPQCRKRFRCRPLLKKNIVLAALVEQLKKMAPPDDHYAGPKDVACDVCAEEKKLKAVKSCLPCVVSYCDTHLQPHLTVAMLKKHHLVAPSDKLQENICHQHNKVKKMYCRTDQQLLCDICCTEKHMGHDTVTSADERTLRQAELEAEKDLVLSTIRKKETHMHTLADKIDAWSQIQQKLERTCNHFSDLIDITKTKLHAVYQQIGSQVSNTINAINNHQTKLQCEVSDLRKILSELEEVSSIPEHNHFLLIYSSRPIASDTQSTNPHKSTQTVTQAGPACNPGNVINPLSLIKDVILLKEKILSAFKNLKLPIMVSVPILNSNTRKNLLRFRQMITVDPNTVYSWIFLSEENKRVTFVDQTLQYPYHPDRFLFGPQVLSAQGMIGSSYWEVEVSGAKELLVAVSYKDIGRNNNTDNCKFGKNANSWALIRINNNYTFFHNSVQTNIPPPDAVGSKIGVYLDHQAGNLSFFSLIEDDVTLLHKVQTTFTKPLFAGLSLGLKGDTARFTELLF